MDTITQARITEHSALRWLHKFGYLTALQLSRLIWPKSASPASALRMAQKLVVRLAENELVIVRKGEPCSPSHIGLSLKGANLLRATDGIDTAVSAKDLLRTVSRHRDACNDTAIALMREWSTVWTEREILTGVAPFRVLGNKMPDCAAFDPDWGVLWVEIENCRRGGRDLSKLARWLHYSAFPPNLPAAILDPPTDRHWLFRVRFVIAHESAASFEKRLATTMKLFGWDPEVAMNRLEFQHGGNLTVW